MAYFGEGKGPIHVDNVKCMGNERSLADCIKQDIGRHNCRHSEDAGVICDYFSKKASGNSNKGKSPSKNSNPSSLLQAELWKQRIPSKENVYSPLWFVLVYGASSSWLGEANRDSKVQGPK